MFTPVNQVRLTNVAIVRMKKTGKRFEIACYKNKVLSWRQGLEKDLDEVLQTDTIFTNVSKGEVAKKEDLTNAFGTTDAAAVAKIILKDGELQVSDKERSSQHEQTWKDIALIVSQQCVNPESKKPYPSTLIEKAMKEIHYSVKPTKTSKQQALDVIKQLSAKMPIERAQMRICLYVPQKESKTVKEAAMPHLQKIEEETKDGNEIQIIAVIDPGNFKLLNDMFSGNTRGLKGKARIDVMDLKLIKDGEEPLS